MRSLKRRFNNLQSKSPCWSSYICFANTVRGQHLSNRSICFWFNKLVEKDDFDTSIKRGCLKNLYDLSNCLSST